MLKDYSDQNKDIFVMFRGTDATHQFQYTLDSGSVFIPGQYTITCEGRLAYTNETPDFTFTVTSAQVDGQWYMTIKFPKEDITSSVRESKVYWRVLATDSSGNTLVINYGEVWLK
jgi:hypothetical protein